MLLVARVGEPALLVGISSIGRPLPSVARRTIVEIIMNVTHVRAIGHRIVPVTNFKRFMPTETAWCRVTMENYNGQLLEAIAVVMSLPCEQYGYEQGDMLYVSMNTKDPNDLIVGLTHSPIACPFTSEELASPVPFNPYTSKEEFERLDKLFWARMKYRTFAQVAEQYPQIVQHIERVLSVED